MKTPRCMGHYCTVNDTHLHVLFSWTANLVHVHGDLLLNHIRKVGDIISVSTFAFIQ